MTRKVMLYSNCGVGRDTPPVMQTQVVDRRPLLIGGGLAFYSGNLSPDLYNTHQTVIITMQITAFSFMT